MTNVPRRLPPTQGQRIRNVTITHASLSGQGRTAAARPVRQSRPTAQIYQPPNAAIAGRLNVARTVTAAELAGGGISIDAWTYTYHAEGAAITLNSPDDGGIYVNTPGIYALTVNIASPSMQNAAPACAVAVVVDSGEFATTPGAQLRGGDGAAGYTMTATASTTQVCPGRGASGGIYVTVIGHDIDPAVVSSVGVEVNVQRVA